MPSLASAPLALTLDVNPSDVLRVRRWQLVGARSYASASAAHDEAEISWVTAGQVSYGLGRRRLELTPGKAIIVPPQVEHDSGFSAATEGRSIKLSVQLLQRVAEALELPGGAPRLVLGLAQDTGPLLALSQLIFREAQRPEAPGHAQMLDALSEALAVQLLRGSVAAAATAPAPGELDRRIAAARAAIEAGYDQPLSVDALARAAGMSRYHFSRRFRDATGQSPYGYLLATRVERAAALLAQGQLNVTEAALTVGFNDLGRFSRRFRELTGMSPAAFRRASNPAASAPPTVAARTDEHESPQTAHDLRSA